VLNDELTEALWRDRPPTKGLNTSDGLLEIIENAVAIMAAGKREKHRQVAQAPRPAPVPPSTGALLSVYFADAGKTGSLPTSRASCWMMTVALRLAAIFLKRSSEASV
jgi:hypothetical protein